MNFYTFKVLYHTCLSMHEFLRMASLASSHESDYPPTSKYDRVPIYLKVNNKSTSKIDVLYHWNMHGFAYFAMLKY